MFKLYTKVGIKKEYTKINWIGIHKRVPAKSKGTMFKMIMTWHEKNVYKQREWDSKTPEALTFTWTRVNRSLHRTVQCMCLCVCATVVIWKLIGMKSDFDGCFDKCNGIYKAQLSLIMNIEQTHFFRLQKYCRNIFGFEFGQFHIRWKMRPLFVDSPTKYLLWQYLHCLSLQCDWLRSFVYNGQTTFHVKTRCFAGGKGVPLLHEGNSLA